jgi:hypothetical protein
MKVTNGGVEWVYHPELTIGDLRDHELANECSGRGSSTAAPRGYNVERLATAVFNSLKMFTRYNDVTWTDTKAWGDGMDMIRIESKSCIRRYPSGGYGQFRIWKDNHDSLASRPISDTRRRIYFLLVYTVTEDGNAVEVGKLAIEIEVMDRLLTDWRQIDHASRGSKEVREISWHLLLSKLGVTVDQFEKESIVVVTDENIQ